jgi:hypothetical protein
MEQAEQVLLEETERDAACPELADVGPGGKKHQTVNQLQMQLWRRMEKQKSGDKKEQEKAKPPSAQREIQL